MSDVHVISLKIGTSHGLWQYKIRGTHERVMMHGLKQILDACCQLLGYRLADRSAVYLFHFSAEPFTGHQVCLRKIREKKEVDGVGCYYRVESSTIGSFSASGFLPAFANADYLHQWPERLYFRLEKSISAG